MTLRMTCKHCRQEITATDEDELVTNVQDHALGHDGKTLTREHILSRFHRPQSQASDQN